MGLETPNEPGSLGTICQYCGLESSKMSDPNPKDFSLSGFGSRRRYWLGSFWSWVDLIGLRKF